MKVVLVRKLADRIDDIDLRESRVGDVLELPGPAGRLLAAEGWAVAERRGVRGAARQMGVRRRRTDGRR